MQTLLVLAQVASGITGIVAALMLLIRPAREHLLGLSAVKDGQKCLLRSLMLHVYYKHRDDRTIRQYEFENFIFAYKAYKTLKGNSFVDKLYSEIKEWEVIS
jgi:hypothetical protein